MHHVVAVEQVAATMLGELRDDLHGFARLHEDRVLPAGFPRKESRAAAAA